MAFIFVGSTGERAGQSLTTWAIVRRLREKGIRMGFYKPFRTDFVPSGNPCADPDVLLFKKELTLQEPLDAIFPCPETGPDISGREPQHFFEKFERRAQNLSSAKDLLLIMGSKHIFFEEAQQPLADVSAVLGLSADLVLVHRYRKFSTSIYSFLSVCSLLRDRVKGVIINRVPPGELPGVREKFLLLAGKEKFPMVTVLPEEPVLSLRTVRNITNILKGKIIRGRRAADNLVESMTVGAADLCGGLHVLKKIHNKIVLLSPPVMRKTGESPLAPRPVAGILLTGNHNPPNRVMEAAERYDIPLVRVDHDTFSARELLKKANLSLTFDDEDKVVRFTAMLDQQDFLERLVASLTLETS